MGFRVSGFTGLGVFGFRDFRVYGFRVLGLLLLFCSFEFWVCGFRGLGSGVGGLVFLDV